MKKVLTAMGNPELNFKLQEIEDLNIKERDIFYKEGIIEFLESDKDIDIIILNIVLCKENLDEFLNTLHKYNVEIFLLLDGNNIDFNLNSQNKELVKMFFKEDDIINFFNNSNYENIPLEKISEHKKVVSILGPNGVGKTIFSSFFGKYLAHENKVLIIDFNIYSNDLKILFDIKKQSNSYELKDLIFKVNKNLYILNGLKYLFNENNKIDSYKIKGIIDELKNNFEYIIIDTSSEINLKYVKTIFPNTDYNIFILEPNILQIKKAKELLEVYLMDFELDRNQTGILINKNNITSIDSNILNNVFEDFKIIGKINYNQKINSYINTYTKNNINFNIFNNIQKILKGGKNNGG